MYGIAAASVNCLVFFFQAEDGIRDIGVTGVQTCALPIYFGPEMEQVFVELREEAAREGGKMGVWRLWWETAKGIFTAAPREHLSMLRQDSTFALRMMGKNLGFTIAAVIVLGLGIGANTAIFSVVNAVLLKPLPYQHGERLLML